jgi:hypothetical protein
MPQTQSRSAWWTILFLSVVLIIVLGACSEDFREVLLSSASNVWVLLGFSVFFVVEGIVRVWSHRNDQKTWKESLALVGAYLKSPSFIRPAIIVYIIFLLVVVVNVPLKMRELRLAAEAQRKLNNARTKDRTKAAQIQADTETASAQDQKKFEDFIGGLATNPNPVRAAIASQMPEPIQLPVISERFDLAANRQARENEAKRKKVAEALEAHDRKEADRVNAENAKIAADIAKAKADERLRICNYVTAKLVSYLGDLAVTSGASVSTSNTGSLKRNFRQLVAMRREQLPPQPPLDDVFAWAQIASNTNWGFSIAVEGKPNSISGYYATPTDIGEADRLIIASPKDAVIRPDAVSRLQLVPDALALEIRLRDDSVSFASIGWKHARVNGSPFPIVEWKQYEIALQLFLTEIDARHPLTK